MGEGEEEERESGMEGFGEGGREGAGRRSGGKGRRSCASFRAALYQNSCLDLHCHINPPVMSAALLTKPHTVHPHPTRRPSMTPPPQPH